MVKKWTDFGQLKSMRTSVFQLFKCEIKVIFFLFITDVSKASSSLSLFVS